ncbi:RING-H2 finger protein ATL79-like [Miscanthus floridulus]|uniref:RING-H2 finger protein ATL79-like n=1 Tax=Miscanthus floridulus TaxID=154761 RepID=UPI003459511B
MAMAPQGQTEHEHDHRSEPNSSHPDPGAAATSSIATNRWGPYSGAGDFASNMAVILAALLTALALALALNAAVRYLLGRSRRARRGRAGSSSGQRDSGASISDPEKPAAEAPPPPLPPALVYSAAECAICLAEFADGDAVRVMPACRHGFHARCIERWLAGGGRSSCPTCRAPAAVAAGSPAAVAQPEAAGPSSS